MPTKRKYPKSFYDDGLGDILEWIDDEVLVHSENKLESGKKSKSSNASESWKSKKTKTKLYGDNEVSKIDLRTQKRVKFEIKDDETDDKPDKRLEDRTRGLINRLAAQTMPYVASEFEKLYSTNQRISITAAIFSNIETSIISKHAITKRKLVAELMLLVSYLSFKISQDIGASIVHKLVRKFEEIYQTSHEEDDKRIDNILSCLVNLYIIGLFNAHVIFEVTQRICSKNFSSKSMEYVLLVIRSVGFQLRKDNPLLTRKLVTMAQESSQQLKKLDSQVSARVEFMIEALGAIKNNNMSRLENYGCDIDRSTIETTLKILIKRTKLPESLSDATYEEILNSPNWYLLETRVDEEKRLDSKSAAQVQGSNKLDVKICKALGLNKPTERTIFSALLRVTDYIEASNIIIGFGLNHCSDAMLVCIHVAIHEKSYNPFYFKTINNLCKFNRKYKMAAKFSIQDKIRGLSRMAPERVDVFKTLCFELIKSDGVPITILKAVEWADLSNSSKTFLVFLLESISDLPDDEKRKIMTKVEKKSSFAGAMRTFANCFLKGCKLFN